MKSRTSAVFATLLLVAAVVYGQAPSGPATGSSRPELVLQVGHTKPVNAVAFSPDGKWLASASDDLTVKLWSLTTGAVVRTIETGTAVATLAISSDATTIAAGHGVASMLPSQTSGAYAVDLFDVGSGRRLRTLGNHAYSVQGVAFSGDGRQLTSVSGDAIKTWEVATGAQQGSTPIDYGKYRDVMASVAEAAVSPDGRLAAIAEYNKSYRIYDVRTGREISDTKVKADVDTRIAFSPDAQSIAILLRDRAVIRGVKGGPDLRVLMTGANANHGKGTPMFSPDGRTLVTVRPPVGTSRGETKVWNLTTGTLIAESGAVAGLSIFLPGSGPLGTFAPDGRAIAEIAGAAIKLTDPLSGREVTVLSAPDTIPMAETDTYRTLVSNPRFMAGLKKMAGVTTPEQALAYFQSHPDQLASYASFLSQEQAATGADLGFLARDAFTFSPDGRWLIHRYQAMKATRTELWSTATGVPARDADISALASIGQPGLSPDGRFSAAPTATGLAAGAAKSIFGMSHVNPSKDPYIYQSSVDLFDAKSHARLHTLSAGKSDDSSFHPAFGFSVEGDLIAISGFNKNHQGIIFVYDTVSGKDLAEFGVVGEPIKVISASSKARLVAVGYGTRVELREMGTGRVLHVLATDDGAKSLSFSFNGRVLGIGNNSGSQELWDVASGEKRATLVNLAGILGGESKEWLVVAPDGLFDGSPAAWGRILWRFSGQTFDVAPVELFFNEFYYPGLLADILHGKQPKATQDIASKDRRQPHLSLASAQASPSSPVSARTVKVAVSVGDAPAGARDVRLFRNGSLVKVWRGDLLAGPASGTNVTLEASVPIVAGPNRFTAYGFNHDDIKSQDAVLTIEGADTLKRGAVLYVVNVGIDTYANAAYNLKYAVADARSFGEELGRQQTALGRFSRVEVVNLTDRDATKANILLALRRLSRHENGQDDGTSAELKKLATAEPEDAVIVYYAGHGTAQQSHFYLIPHDLGYSGDRDNLDEGGVRTILQHSISDIELEQAMEEVDAGQIVLVIDACNSGQALEAEEKRRGPMNSKGLAQLAYEKGMDILTAAQSYQAALEAAQLGHGYLTFALVEEGLRTGAADMSPHDGQVEVREWLDYATSRVPQMQEQKIEETRAQGRELAFARGDEGEEGAGAQQVQRPRVFYRREVRPQPFVVAIPKR